MTDGHEYCCGVFSNCTWKQYKSGAIGFVVGVVFLALCIYGVELHNKSSSLKPDVFSTEEITSSSKLSDHGKTNTDDARRVEAGPSTVAPRTQYRHVIMCMIFTTPEMWMSKALAVRLTWAKRCDFHKFFYSKSAEVRLDGAYALDVPEGRDHLTRKTMEALRVSFNFYGNNVDWYVKADDDTYIIMENLRHILYQYDPGKPHYLGHRSTDLLINGYNGGGASYSLSQQAAARVVQDGGELCPKDGYVEDLDMGRCLEAFQIYPVDLTDEKGRLRFHPDHPIKLLAGDHSAQQVYKYRKDNVTFGYYQGIPVLSPGTVSFHYMDPAHMYMYDFLLYDLQRPLLTSAQGQG